VLIGIHTLPFTIKDCEIVVVQTEESYCVNKPGNKPDCPQIIQSLDAKVSCDHHTYIPGVEFMFPLRLGRLE
jgi:hypothetical protein